MDNQNQYNFIMDSAQKNGSGPAFLQDPKKSKIAALIFVLVVIAIVGIGILVFTSINSSKSSALTDVVGYQTEITRVTELGLKDAKEISVRSKITTLQTFIGSDLTKTSKFAGQIEKTKIATYKDPVSDKTLADANATNTFDKQILKVLDQLNQKYQVSLKKAFDDTSSKNDQETLNRSNENIVIYNGL